VERKNALSEEKNLYKDILPVLVSQESLLQIKPPPPPISAYEFESTNRAAFTNLNKKEDSIQAKQKILWKEHLDTTIYLLLVHESLFSMQEADPFVTPSVEFLATKTDSLLYLNLIYSKLPTALIYFDTFDFTSYYNATIKSEKNLSSNQVVHGYIKFSRVSFNEEMNKACFLISYLSANGLQGFESFFMANKENDTWLILNSSRK
jgi:hypothetical protein